jgi:hypothetical protein
MLGLINCSDNQFTTVLLRFFHMGVVRYINVGAVKNKYNIRSTAVVG